MIEIDGTDDVDGIDDVDDIDDIDDVGIVASRLSVLDSVWMAEVCAPTLPAR